MDYDDNMDNSDEAMNLTTCFKAPKKYNKLSISEDAEIDDWDPYTDLWLIRAPSNLNFNLMQNVEVSLKHSSSHPLTLEKRTVRCSPNKQSENLEGFTLLLPDKTTKRLKPAESAFTGQLVFSEEFELPEIQLPAVTQSTPSIPSGIKERFVPFGTSLEETVSPKRKKKKKKRDSELPEDLFANMEFYPKVREDAMFTQPFLKELTFDEPSAHVEKKHKKKKQRKVADEDAEMSSPNKGTKSGDKKHKKKKHKSSKEST